MNPYELLDSGNGYKLERFSSYVLSRPDPQAIWRPSLPKTEWDKADAIFRTDKKFTGARWDNRRVKEPWLFSVENITLLLKLTPFKHTGVFPEQMENWRWMGNLILRRPACKILNLFGYTGGATLYAAQKGAHVTHVDASKPTMAWARENQTASALSSSPIRWIMDDAKKFVSREIKRGMIYDAIIMDPPSFGRDPKGKVFKFEKDVPELLRLVSQILPNPLFFLLNSYAQGYSPETVKNLLGEIFPLNSISGKELFLQDRSGKKLHAGVCARFENSGK